MAGFDADGKLIDRDALRSVTPDARKGTRRKVTDESNDQVKATRIESDTERSLNITPRTVEFGRD